MGSSVKYDQMSRKLCMNCHLSYYFYNYRQREINQFKILPWELKYISNTRSMKTNYWEV